MARDSFKQRKGVRGKLKVWEWSEDDRILIRERVNSSGGLGYRIVFPRSVTGDTELFLQSRDFEKAKDIARTKGKEFRISQSTARILGDGQRIQAASAIRILNEAGVTLPLDAIAREYVEGHTGLLHFDLSVPEGLRLLARVLPLAQQTGKSLQDIVEYAAIRLKPAGGDKTMAQLADEMIEIKRGWHEKGDLRLASFRDFEARAKRVARDIGGFPLAEMTKDTLVKWLDGAGAAPRTKKNYRMVLAEMLRYAQQKRYVVENPLGELTRQDVKELEGRGGESTQPAILSPTQAEKLLTVAFANPHLDLGAAVALGLFCGIRTEELKRLMWDALRLDEKEPFIVIGPEIAKKRRIRNVTIPGNAVAWLRRWTHGKKVTKSTHTNDFQKRFRKLQKLAGFGQLNANGEWVSSWESNAMRHSFGSYHFALHGNSIETARLLGHKADDNVLFAHYRALATKSQAESYFGILPAVKEGKIVPFATVG